MIDFGPWSTTLAFGMGFGLAVALLLLATSRNWSANVLLAGVLVVVSLKLAEIRGHRNPGSGLVLPHARSWDRYATYSAWVTGSP